MTSMTTPLQATAQRPAFHLAFLTHDLDEARRFYVERLGCTEGRSAPSWVDFEFYGHQLSVHLQSGFRAADDHGQVDREDVPMPHFGVILNQHDWAQLADRLTSSGQEFVLAPHTRFAGEAGEQSTMFLLDPSGNALEFKGLRELERLFAS